MSKKVHTACPKSCIQSCDEPWGHCGRGLEDKASEKGHFVHHGPSHQLCPGLPIDNKSPEEISKKIINLWLKAGFPRMKKMISDNGPEFTDGPMVTVLQMLNAKHQATAAYTPQQNGAIERVRVHCVCDENMSIAINDDEALDWAVHAYNNAIDRDRH